MLFKVKRIEKYDFISCNRDYDCNKKKFESSLARNPAFFASWSEIADEDGTFTVEITNLVDSPNAEILKNTLALSNSCQFSSSIYDTNDNLLVGHKEIEEKREQK